MPEPVKVAFESALVTVPADAILPLHQVTEAQKQSTKYKLIATSIAEVGIIEPLVVARPKDGDSRYLLLDGHLRFAVLVDLGEREIRCLISDDDESYTYNKRINRLATIQEHYMIMRALARGVPEEKIAKALDLDIKQIKRRRTLLEGICPEVIELLKDKSVNPRTIETLKKMKPGRQIEAAELMAAAGNFTGSYAQALLAATRQHDLVNAEKPKEVGGITPEQMARMEREMESLQRDFKAIEASYGDDVLQLVIATGYLTKLVGNADITRYLAAHHPEFLEEFRAIISAASLDQTASTN
jgi:ParB-like chromosome segregation protein Spo0J